VNLTDFETFFPEKRPFFVEGAQIFDNFGRNGANNYYGFMRTEPDLFVFDGHGLAHPRRMGLACHLGLCLDKPAIGCAKSRLCGEHEELPPDAGAWVPLRDGAEIIGAVVRTQQCGRPVYVSVGHKVDLETAIRWVLATCGGFRLPEPCRLAHRAASHSSGDPHSSSARTSSSAPR
jgi:deoxyribonuclease V